MCEHTFIGDVEYNNVLYCTDIYIYKYIYIYISRVCSMCEHTFIGDSWDWLGVA